MTARLLALLLLLAPLPAAAEIVLPTGFSTHVYVTGEGFDTDSGVRIAAGTWIVNEVLRISGPFDELIRGR